MKRHSDEMEGREEGPNGKKKNHGIKIRESGERRIRR